LACRDFSVQRFARCAGSLRFSTFCALAKLAAHALRVPLRQRSLDRKMSAMLGCTDSPKNPDKPTLQHLWQIPAGGKTPVPPYRRRLEYMREVAEMYRFCTS